ncbi:MAG: glycosyltransferase family 9 protein [Gammaproteobacteria bacterium]|jgi:ADP-heptose:LPS heptosyltransferase
MHDFNQKPRFLINRNDNIGDLVLTIPTIGLLKREFPDATIDLLAKSYVKPIADCCPWIDNFINWNDLQALPPKQAAAQLAAQKYTAFLNIFAHKQAAKLANLAKIPVRIGTNRRYYHWLYCNKLINFSRKKSKLHEAQLNTMLLQGLNITAPRSIEALIPLLKIAPKPDKTVTNLLNPHKFTLVMHPGSNGNGREWPITHYKKLSELLDADKYQILVTGSDKESYISSALCTNESPHIHDLVGKLTLDQLLYLLQQVDGLIASGTGPMHLAAALNTNTLGLFPPLQSAGPTRWRPIGTNANFLLGKNKCSEKNCSNKNCSCMQAIKPIEVSSVIENWRKQGSKNYAN